MQEKKFINSLDFVARYYRKGAFIPRKGVFTAPLRVVRPFWQSRRAAIAASVAGTVLVASACVYTLFLRDAEPAKMPVSTEQTAPVQTAAQVHRIDFADMPLSKVVAEIEKTYNVKISNVPQQEYSLTLSYEGTAEDLVATINELLGTEMEVKL